MGSEKITHFYGCHVASSNSVKQHKLRKRIAWLSNKEGREIEFISLYIPSTTSIDEIVVILKNAYDSKVIKDERVSNRFHDTFKNTIQHLKLRKEIPENGLAIFSGTLANNQENEIFAIEEIVPPEPLVNYVFEIDDHFYLEPLRQMLRNPRTVGFIVMDSKGASFGLLNGERFELNKNITSGIPGKSKKGGQSQRRYERERNMELGFFFHRVAEYATKEFLENNKVMALIVGGPGTTKDKLIDSGYLHYELKNALLNTVDTQSVGKEGLNEILDKSSETLKNMCLPEEKIVVHRFLEELHKQNGLAIYGLETVLVAINNGEVETVLVTDNTELIEIVATCKRCGSSKKKIIYNEKKAQFIQEMVSKTCKKCNANEYEVEEKDIIDVLEDAASQTDARVEVITTASEEKTQLTVFGGIAALLRYHFK